MSNIRTAAQQLLKLADDCVEDLKRLVWKWNEDSQIDVLTNEYGEEE